VLILCVVRAFTVRETTYYESDAAFLKRILGGRKGRSPAILVMNDEAHHACRRGTESRSRKMLSVGIGGGGVHVTANSDLGCAVN